MGREIVAFVRRSIIQRVRVLYAACVLVLPSSGFRRMRQWRTTLRASPAHSCRTASRQFSAYVSGIISNRLSDRKIINNGTCCMSASFTSSPPSGSHREVLYKRCGSCLLQPHPFIISCDRINAIWLFDNTVQPCCKQLWPIVHKICTLRFLPSSTLTSSLSSSHPSLIPSHCPFPLFLPLPLAPPQLPRLCNIVLSEPSPPPILQSLSANWVSLMAGSTGEVRRLMGLSNSPTRRQAHAAYEFVFFFSVCHW